MKGRAPERDAGLAVGIPFLQQVVVKHLFAQTGNVRHHRRGAFGGKFLREALQERCGVGVEVVFSAGATGDNQDDLAALLVGIGADESGEFRQRGAADGLEGLGDFAGQHGLARPAKNLDHGVEALGETMGSLIKNKGDRCPCQLREAVGATDGLRRQEALEQETVRGQTRGAEGSNGSAGPRHGHDRKAHLLDVPHQPVAGIRDEGRTGIRDQGDAATRGETVDQLVQGTRVAVVVIGHGRCLDGEMLQQTLAVAGVLGGDQSHGLQHIHGPVRYIAQVSDGSGHDIEPGFHFSPYNVRTENPAKHTMTPIFPNRSGRRLATGLILITLGLWGCSTPPPAEPPPVEPPPEPSQPAVTRPSVELPPSDFEALFRQAEHDLMRFDWMAAEHTLTALPDEQLTLDDAARLAYQRARITFIRGDTQQALYALRALDNPGVHPALRYRALNFQRHIESLAGNHAESARLCQALMPLTPEVELANLQWELWRELQRADDDQLQRALAAQTDPVHRGWLELALLARNERTGTGELALWRDSHPQHPAAQALPGGLAYRAEAPAPSQRVALLLPLSGRLAPAGKAVRDGYLASFYAADARLRAGRELLVLDQDTYESTGAAYDDAVLQGAGVVVGPLSKKSVAELARRPDRPVPVVALNRSTTAASGDMTLVQLSLSPEDEAIHIAELAFGQGARRALVLRPATTWGDKMEEALEERWRALGGSIASRVAYEKRENYSDNVKQGLGIPASERRARDVRDMLATNIEFTARRRQDIDVIFLLAGNSAEARSLKPLLAFHYAGSVPVYATSSIYSGIADPRDRDLEGINLVEIPWLLGSSPGLRVAIAAGDTGTDAYTRLNALGADAFLLQEHFSALQAGPRFLLRGNTGLLSMDAEWRIHRELPAATFDGGVLAPQ